MKLLFALKISFIGSASLLTIGGLSYGIYFWVMSKKIAATLSIGFVNDIRANIEGVLPHCELHCGCLLIRNYKVTCTGGLARMYTAYQQLKKNESELIFLNAGNTFKGTIAFWIFNYNIAKMIGNFTFDAATVGTVEFDRGRFQLESLFRSWKESKLVLCNMDASDEPLIEKLYTKSTVITRHGKKIGITGVIHESLIKNTVANYGKLKFTSALECINDETDRLVNKKGVFAVIVLSQSGFNHDIELAEKVHKKVGVIVGGYTKTILYSSKPPEGGFPDGPYPSIIEQGNGHKVLVVTTEGLTKYIGHLKVNYNGFGDILSWSGAPIYLNDNFPEDQTIRQEINDAYDRRLTYLSMPVGETTQAIDSDNCTKQDCPLANLITDAFVWIARQMEENSANYISLFPQKHMEVVYIEAGDITRKNVLDILPEGNLLHLADLKGIRIVETLKHSITLNPPEIIHMSGMHVVFNITKPIGQRLTSVKLHPDRGNEEPLDLNDFYKIVVPSYFIFSNEYPYISRYAKNVHQLISDTEALRDYLSENRPFKSATNPRLRVLT